MEFRTQIPVKQEQPKIDYHSKIFLAGSCFVENIGGKLEYYKLQKLQNPFGILFHPMALENFFSRVVNNYKYSEENLFFHQERWHCFEAHSALSHPDKNVLLNNLNITIQDSSEFLKHSSHVIITLGTAWSYFHLKEEITVANCHKIPQKEFRKKLQSVPEIEHSLKIITNLLAEINPEITVIFTVSPVRHIRDGFVQNMHSKANLISAVNNILQGKNTTLITYFPSFEIMMDELRDYRFYAEDMLHPSRIAVDYIWQRFIESWFSSDAISTMELVEKIQKGLAHRPFNENSEAHKIFLAGLQEKIAKLESAYPHIQF